MQLFYARYGIQAYVCDSKSCDLSTKNKVEKKKKKLYNN